MKFSEYTSDLPALIQSMHCSDFQEILDESISFCISSIENKNKLLLCGNGGSAADSQHMAAEYVSKLQFDRGALPAIAFTTDTSALTAIGNDYGYENVFSRQIEGLGKEGDTAFLYTTSGDSPNIIRAAEVCSEMSIKTIALTGNKDGKIDSMVDVAIKVPHSNTARIQECHAMIGHYICSKVERHFFKLP